MTVPHGHDRLDVITVADVEQAHTLVGYWIGTIWCPAIDRTPTGYDMRIVIPSTAKTGNVVYGHVNITEDGVVHKAPTSFMPSWTGPGMFSPEDLDAAVVRYRTPSRPMPPAAAPGWVPDPDGGPR